ncbi:MAG: asparagine synthase (glutamine-hydrolyzing) [Nitrospirae bacterium]|nr:asparagine synthase (glutamine-hydrolyzing) [Nitrospirota bacterium]MBF0534593.1 asparagine synthase (glutamine-hydrolyzing) [Nitrospirota bacterium]MBF0616363.1 asparagine synthase (glutamine-hydrolyzing) [Nitrospirota bacterium]
MCGIFGIVTNGSAVSPVLVSQITNILKHRGPDDEGYLAVNSKTGAVYNLTGDDSVIAGRHINSFNEPVNMFLGHRRLAILDLSPAAHQPMSYQNRYYLIYNGEIYNYVELRDELRAEGYSFTSNSDSEVLLASYDRWKDGCVDKFNGMWAFAIYDRVDNRLFCSRDRFGVKPFYYATGKFGVAFASEIKALLAFPDIKRTVNEAALYDYLATGNEGQFLTEIDELPPSHTLTIELHSDLKVKIKKYYTLNINPALNASDGVTADGAALRVRELILSSVSLRLRSDVTCGSCLSGGIDSTSIVCAIDSFIKKEHMSQVGVSQKTFTASYKDAAIDESRWAQIVASQTNTQWYQTYPTAHELLNDLDDLIYTQDIPFRSTSIYAQYRVMKLAHEHGVKVLLDGQGADELFAGYPMFYGAFFSNLLIEGNLKRFISELAHMGNAPLSATSVLTYMLKSSLMKSIPDSLKNIFTGGLNNHLSEQFKNAHKGRLSAILNEKYSGSLNTMLMQYMLKENLQCLLKYEDRNSMRFSIESRVPFADDTPLIEYAFSLPGAFKIHNGWSKYVFRRAVSGLVPEAIQWRKDKVAFNTPERLWIKEIYLYLMQSIKSETAGYFKPAVSEKLMNSPGGWRAINLSLWLKALKKPSVFR